MFNVRGSSAPSIDTDIKIPPPSYNDLTSELASVQVASVSEVIQVNGPIRTVTLSQNGNNTGVTFKYNAAELIKAIITDWSYSELLNGRSPPTRLTVTNQHVSHDAIYLEGLSILDRKVQITCEIKIGLSSQHTTMNTRDIISVSFDSKPFIGWFIPMTKISEAYTNILGACVKRALCNIDKTSITYKTLSNAITKIDTLVGAKYFVIDQTDKDYKLSCLDPLTQQSLELYKNVVILNSRLLSTLLLYDIKVKLSQELKDSIISHLKDLYAHR